MKTTSFLVNRYLIACSLLAIITLLMLSSCRKPDQNNNPVDNYSSIVLDKWMTMQLRLIRNSTGIQNQAFSRHFAYTGITALESITPGLPIHLNWSGRWNGLTGLPGAGIGMRYYYPANVNAAMAAINKAFFPGAVEADKLAIDSLENALNQEFLIKENPSRVNSSAQFGKAVANAVYNWSETDGYKIAGAPYTAPVGAGLWTPTPPALAPAASPYWGNNRPVIKGSLADIQLEAPVRYSTDPNSAFYQMAKHVYDVSQSLTDEQKAMAIYWRDVPGVSSPGHWESILQQVTRQTNSKLDKAALAYALTGAAINDGLISCWQAKYKYNLVRPVTYIRDVMGQTSWAPYLGTPPHPEYSSAHAVLSMAAAEILQKLFGNIGSFTDHTYDYMGFPSRTYSSFSAIGREAGQSRLYAGIHYQPSIDVGILQGKMVAANILPGPGDDR